MLLFTYDYMHRFDLHMYNRYRTLLKIKRFRFRAHVVQANYVISRDAGLELVLKYIVFGFRGAYRTSDF